MQPSTHRPRLRPVVLPRTFKRLLEPYQEPALSLIVCFPLLHKYYDTYLEDDYLSMLFSEINVPCRARRPGEKPAVVSVCPPDVCPRLWTGRAGHPPPFAVIGVNLVLLFLSPQATHPFSLGPRPPWEVPWKGPLLQTLGFPALDLVPQSCRPGLRQENPGPLALSRCGRETWPAPHPRDRGFSLLFSVLLPAYLRNV